MPPHYVGFMITLRHTTLGTTFMDEWSVQHRDLYLTAHNTHKRQASMRPSGIQTHNPSKRTAADWDHVVIGTDPHLSYAGIKWQTVKHDQKYTESYHTKKSHYSKTQTSYPNAKLHIKIIYNIFSLKHPHLHVKNKCAFCWFTLHNCITMHGTKNI